MARAPLLIIDDLGIASVPGKAYRDLLEILDDRHGQGATLMTSQFPVKEWHQVIADATVADAILDRLVHNAYRLELKGETMRKNTGLDPEKQKPKTSRITGAPICAGEASPLRVATGGNANWSSGVRSRRSPARANRRRDNVCGLTTASLLRAPKQHGNDKP